MISKPTRLLFATAFLCTAAHASTVFSFDSDGLGTATGFTDKVNGISAAFSSAGDPGGFVVYQSMFETLTGNVLGDPGPAGLDSLALTINFSTNLSAVVLDFATADFGTPSPFTLSAYQNSHLVGSATSTGEFLNGFPFPEGEISFSGATFNGLVLSSTSMDFAVDNITVLSAAPEPAAGVLLAAGLLVLLGICVSNKQ